MDVINIVNALRIGALQAPQRGDSAHAVRRTQCDEVAHAIERIGTHDYEPSGLRRREGRSTWRNGQHFAAHDGKALWIAVDHVAVLSQQRTNLRTRRLREIANRVLDAADAARNILPDAWH